MIINLREGFHPFDNFLLPCEFNQLMPNYCPYCGRFMQMQDFEHACDQVNRMRDVKEWCSRCGGSLKGVTDDLEKALCHGCMSRITTWPKDR